jgi:hypothetical protein
MRLLSETGIAGRITDPSSAAIVTAMVTATGDDGSKFSTLTNTQGIYQFPIVRAAKYILRLKRRALRPPNARCPCW